MNFHKEKYILRVAEQECVYTKHAYQMRQQRDGHDGLAEAHFVCQNAVKITLVHRHLTEIIKLENRDT